MHPTRRSFLTTAATAAAGAAAASRFAPAAAPLAGTARRAELRIGLIGCGGRGTGAAAQALRTGPDVRLVAVADAFGDRIDRCLASLAERSEEAEHDGKNAFAPRIDVPKERRFTGFDGWRGLLDAGVDVVLIATPPHFRPAHFAGAVEKGLHVFLEKPVAVDPPGVRAVLAAAAAARAKKLSVVSGLQRRHQQNYLAAMERVHGGALGRILFARCSWNMGSLWHADRKPGMSDLDWQVRNWLYFTWLSGDHIVEQHVHNLDVVNWALKAHPVSARGMGGRQVRTDPKFGHVFDHHAVQYRYADGAYCFSECRQIDGCADDVSEHLYGTDGECHLDGFTPLANITGKSAWTWRGANNDPYQTEIDLLFAAVREGRPMAEGEYVAESTLTAIMGRMATYSGREITWEQALQSEERWGPDRYDVGDLPVDPVAMPGRAARERRGG